MTHSTQSFDPESVVKIYEELHSLPMREQATYARSIRKAFRSDIHLENELHALNMQLADTLAEDLIRILTSPHLDISQELMRILKACIVRPEQNSYSDTPDRAPEAAKPKFPTSIHAVNDLTGGGYGFTIILGDAKAGKTTFAIGSALEAAKEGWRVLYLNAELDRNEIILAIRRYCRGSLPKEVVENLLIVSPETTFEPSDAIRRMEEHIQLGDEQLLFVFDSINALVDYTSEGRKDLDYWSVQDLWMNFAVRATRASYGKIAFLAVSETNKDGRAKGIKVEFKGDMVVKISKHADDSSYVDLDVTLSRSTRSGELGKHYRDWHSGRFQDGEEDTSFEAPTPPEPQGSIL